MQRRAFTIIEVVVAVALVTLISAVAVARLGSYGAREELLNNLTKISECLEAARLQRGVRAPYEYGVARISASNGSVSCTPWGVAAGGSLQSAYQSSPTTGTQLAQTESTSASGSGDLTLVYSNQFKGVLVAVSSGTQALTRPDGTGITLPGEGVNFQLGSLKDPRFVGVLTIPAAGGPARFVIPAPSQP